ncbi:MAG: hypothetical protein RL076_2018, partial [Chloroflexota bacterium]
MNTTRLYRFIVMMTIGVMCITSIWSEPNTQSVVEAKPSVRQLTVDEVDASAHKLGSEWHDARNVPYVVDFSPPSASEVN